jgi:bifunctional UDP-N-acetylglucosamine pyrophosphorylase/glucosamine-1-phosphate N-acetyltransferase
MHSAQPKVLHPLLGRPMALWTLDAARLAGVASFVVVLSPATEALRAELPAETLVVVQAEPRGTGDAVRNALAVLPRGVTEVVIACGDTPLLTPADILGVAEARAAANAANASGRATMPVYPVTSWAGRFQ